jgi:hypothetical protein
VISVRTKNSMASRFDPHGCQMLAGYLALLMSHEGD